MSDGLILFICGIVSVWYMGCMIDGIVRSKRLKSLSENLNLNQSSLLRFDKTDYYDEYIVEYYNPVLGKYMKVPLQGGKMYGEWSFYRIPYGTDDYDVYCLKVNHTQIEQVKEDLYSLERIQELFNGLNRLYHANRESERRI